MSYRAVVLGTEAAALVQAGRRDLSLSRAGVAVSTEAGRPLRLLGPAGRALGLALCDPENDRLRVMAHAEEGFETISPSLFSTRVARALALRRSFGLVGEGRAFHAIHGAGDGLPGFAADVLGAWAVVYVHGRALLAHGQEIARALVEHAGLRGCVLKLRSRGAASQGRVSQHVVGEAPPARLVVEERGVPFEVHLDRGLNTGLFTDMREHRHGLTRCAAGRRVLNGFSYTGTLSVAAARAGAACVTSVDLSSGVQRWAQDNFRLSGLDPDSAPFRFEASDTARFVETSAREGRVYDLVLLDPPAFSAARGAEFALDRDFPTLIARTCALLPEGGLLWLACNARTSSLVALAEAGLRAAGRPAALLDLGGLPPDHPTLPAQPEDRYLQVALYRLD